MPTFPDSQTTGIRYKFFDDVPRNFAAVTDSWEYEDGVRDFNRRTSNPPREWRLECLVRSKAERAIFDDFWEDVGIDIPFDFTDKYGDIWSNVRVKTYSRSHEGHKSWRKQVVFELIGYNSVITGNINWLSEGGDPLTWDDDYLVDLGAGDHGGRY